MFQVSVQSVHLTLTHLKETTPVSLVMLHALNATVLRLTARSAPLTMNQLLEMLVRFARLATSLLRETTLALSVTFLAILVLES